MNERVTLTDSFTDIKAGDTVTRYFYGLRQTMKVDHVDDTLIHTEGGWTFDRKTGVEEDPDLGFGLKSGITCSWLVR